MSLLAALVSQLAARRVMVVGDVILDEYIIGRANRLSREAPIPVLEFERRTYIPGGAANPAMNIAALGSAVVQVGVVGTDAEAETLRAILAEKGIDSAGLISDAERPTTTKTRVLAQMGLRFPQQVARIDRIARQPINGAVEVQCLAALDRYAPTVQAILISDYLSGLLTPALVARVRALSNTHRLLCTADAQGELEKYRGFDLVKCNADELATALRTGRLSGDADYAQAAGLAVEQLDLRGAMLVTRGAEGVTLAMRSGEVAHFAASQIEDVYDTVGAGDTVIAVVTLALLTGASYPLAAQLANAAAGIVVRRVGNYAPTPSELMTEVEHG